MALATFSPACLAEDGTKYDASKGSVSTPVAAVASDKTTKVALCAIVTAPGSPRLVPPSPDPFEILSDIDYGRLTEPGTIANEAHGGNQPKSGNKARSVVNYIFDLRGIDYSKEGADLALDSPSDIDSKFMRDIDLQMRTWETNRQTTYAILQLARNVGAKEMSPDQVADDLHVLYKLIGKAHSDPIWGQLMKMTSENLIDLPGIKIPEDFEARNRTAERMVDQCLQSDPIYQTTSKQLRLYSDKSKLARNASKVEYTTLTVAALAPSIVGPIAAVTLMGAKYANGGPEQDKLLKEVYLSKLLEKRRAMISNEVNTALDAYDLGRAQNNVVLQHTACSLLRHMCGPTYNRDAIQNTGPVQLAGKSAQWVN